MSQKIYILINEAMPGYVKIGKTAQDLESRVRQLDTTGVPLPFEVFYAAEVENMDTVERLLHGAYADRRVRKNREFFEIAPELVADAVRLAEITNITPIEDIVESIDDQNALNEARRKRRESFNFKMVDIPKGSFLTFTKDESLICEVHNNKRVIFEGEEMSLSDAAKYALEKLGIYWKSAQGPVYRSYEGETLNERRERFEESEEL